MCVVSQRPQQIPGLSEEVKKVVETKMHLLRDEGKLLYAAANKSLDSTIEKIGPARFEEALAQFRKTRAQVTEQCLGGLGCNAMHWEKRDWTFKNCYWRDTGCNFRCIGAILSLPHSPSQFRESAEEHDRLYGTETIGGRPGVELSWIYHLGMLEVQVMGPPDGPLAIAAHGLNPGRHAIRDFDMVASRMAEKGYRVLLPNLHSNPKAAIKAISDAGFQKVLVDLVELRTSEGNARGVLPLLLGKSGGDGAVARFAANFLGMVQKLALACPDPEVQAQMAQALCETVLLAAMS
jgi:hypothetical protein